MEIEKLDEQISACLERQQLQLKLNNRLEDLSKQIVSKNADINTKKATMESEQSDVHRLENLSIKKIFTDILGSTEEQLQKERQEYLDAVYAYNAAVDELEAIQYEHNLLTNKSKGEVNVDSQLTELIHQKELYLNQKSEAVRRTIRDFDQQISSYQDQLREINEAGSAGNQCVEYLTDLYNDLYQIHNHMNRPKNQRGFFSNMQVKTLLDKSTQMMAKTQTQLNYYNKELRDVFSTLNMSLRITGFDDFLKKFYTFFVMEWVKRRSLELVLGDIRQTRNNVDSYQSELTRLKEARQTKLDELLNDKRLYIIQA